jgi:hypothetical protein
MSGSGEPDGVAWAGSAVVMAVVLQKRVGPSGAVSGCAPGALGATAGGADDVTKVDMPTTNESLLRMEHVLHPARPLGGPSTLS